MTNELPSAKLPPEIADYTIGTLDLFVIFQRLANEGISGINVRLLIDLVAEYWDDTSE